MTNNVQMMIGSTYNLKVKIAGNTIEFKRYRVAQKAIKKGEKSIEGFMPFELSESEMLEYGVDLTPIDREVEKEQKYYKNLRATRSKVFDLINANVRNNKDFNGNHQRIKFMTLTFGDKIMVDKIEYAYSELTEFMKRLSYFHFKTKANVIKYLSTFELQPSGRIHFHIVVFNMPFISNRAADGYPLTKVWGNGFVGINALKRKNGKNIDIDKVAGYVIKYMTKGTKVEGGQVKINVDTIDQDIYTYENYKKFGLENVKKFSASKGLKKPSEYKAFISAEQFKVIIKGMREQKQFKKIYDRKDKSKFDYLNARSFSVMINNMHLNDIWVANGNLKFDDLDAVHKLFKKIETENTKTIKGSFAILKHKSFLERKEVEDTFNKYRAYIINEDAEKSSWLF